MIYSLFHWFCLFLSWFSLFSFCMIFFSPPIIYLAFLLLIFPASHLTPAPRIHLFQQSFLVSSLPAYLTSCFSFPLQSAILFATYQSSCMCTYSPNLNVVIGVFSFLSFILSAATSAFCFILLTSFYVHLILLCTNLICVIVDLCMMNLLITESWLIETYVCLS